VDAGLAGTMKAAGIGYAPLGAELGGRREPQRDSVNTALEEGPFRGYADHMRSLQFEAGIDLLEELARERRTAVMCAEADWTRCHRSLLADALTVRGWRILHLEPTGALAQHELTDFVVVEGGLVTYPEPQTSLGL
jgi:uncharacterized protein (DUF488 family)